MNDDDELRIGYFKESELVRVNEPGPCPLCGRPTLAKDTGGQWCSDEDSTCWRGGEPALQELERRRREEL